MSNLLLDFRYALRGFARRPMFVVIIVLTLGCGISVNNAVLSLIEQTLLRPLPVNDPEALVNFISPGPQARSASNNAAGSIDQVFSYPMFRDLERLQEPFVGIAAHRAIDANVAVDGQTVSDQAMLVSGNYFSLLGVAPAAGRTLGPGDEGDIAETAMLSYSYWQNTLSADPTVIGQTVTVNGQLLTIVGIAPKNFHGTTLGVRPAVFVPITFPPRPEENALEVALGDRTYSWLYLFARLQPGVSIGGAEAAINAPYQAILNNVEVPLLRNFNAQATEQFRNKALTLVPGARGQSVLPFQARTPLTIALMVTAIVLVIACVNLANLMLARGATRVGEIAVRASLGAARSRLLTLMLVESLLLAAFAVVAALPLTLAALRGIGFLLRNDPFVSNLDFALDAHAIAFGGGLALLSVILFGLLPALKLARTDPGPILQDHGTRSSSGRGMLRFRATLATTQVALSMVLLVMAGLFTQSLINIARIDLGISTDSLATFRISPGLNGYTPERSAFLFDQIEEELAALPGVTATASAMVPLLADSNAGVSVGVESFEAPASNDANVRFNIIGAGFFGTVGVPLMSGRNFSAADTANSPLVAIVNERFAERFGLGRDAIGKRIDLGFREEAGTEIIGVVRDSKYSTVKDPVPAQLFLPRRQAPFPINDLTYYVRSAGADPTQLLNAIPQVVARADPTLPVNDLRTVDQQVRENVSDDRLVTMLATALATVATVLAALGLYGMLSFTVTQRTREIGLRLALGAGRRQLRHMVLSQVAWMGIVGGIAGLVAALALGRVAARLLFGLEATHAPAYFGAAAVLVLVVGAAAYLPARRASRIDPVAALRAE
jgi:predicted permease